MAIESPTLAQPIADATQTDKGTASLERPARIRNEYPEAYDELEDLERKVTAPKQEKPTAQKPAAAAKPADKKPESDTGRDEAGRFTKPADKPQDKVAEKPDAEAKPGEKVIDKPADKPAEGSSEVAEIMEATRQFKTAHDLRKDWRRLHKMVEEREAELTQLRAKAEKAPINTAVLDENKALKKRLEEVETELRYVDFTKSNEFKEKFEKPYQEAFGDAVEEIRELRVTLPDGGTRPATETDFQRILQADTQDVRGLANEMFGEAAGDVLAMRRRLMELQRTANRESKRYREQAAERERERILKQTEEREQTQHLWNKSFEMVKVKHPEYFDHIEGDEEYNKTMDEGYKTVEKAYDAKLPIEERMARMATQKHKAAVFGARELKIRRLESRVKELEEVIKGYEESAPAGGKGGSETERVGDNGDGSGYKSAEEEIDALARQDTAD